jgi:hypothetical protein
MALKRINKVFCDFRPRNRVARYPIATLLTFREVRGLLFTRS